MNKFTVELWRRLWCKGPQTEERRQRRYTSVNNGVQTENQERKGGCGDKVCGGNRQSNLHEKGLVTRTKVTLVTGRENEEGKGDQVWGSQGNVVYVSRRK